MLCSPCIDPAKKKPWNSEILIAHKWEGSKVHPPVWWKTGEAAPDWPEKEVVNDRPVLSGRFEVDPFREDCHQKLITFLNRYVDIIKITQKMHVKNYAYQIKCKHCFDCKIKCCK